jgi:hypothetical protein
MRCPRRRRPGGSAPPSRSARSRSAQVAARARMCRLPDDVAEAHRTIADRGRRCATSRDEETGDMWMEREGRSSSPDGVRRVRAAQGPLIVFRWCASGAERITRTAAPGQHGKSRCVSADECDDARRGQSSGRPTRTGANPLRPQRTCADRGHAGRRSHAGAAYGRRSGPVRCNRRVHDL